MKVLDYIGNQVSNYRLPDRKSIVGILGIFFVTGVILAPDSMPPMLPRVQKALTKPLQYEVSVILKLIQVYVTDKSGRPVKDLTKEEFTITDNSKPVTITEFEKHDLAPALPETEAPPPEEKPAPASAELPSIRRKFIILFDFAYNTQKGLTASIKAAQHFLDSEVRQEDELAFLSISMLKGLKIHEFLTTDHDKVRRALTTVTAKDISGRADEVENAYWKLVELAPTSGELARLEVERWDSTRQAENYFLTLTRLAKALRLIQGQKSVLFFSNGVPTSLINSSRRAGTSGHSARGTADPGTGGSGKSTGSTFEVGNSVLRPLQETMLKEFSASSCSFYAFDTRESSKVPSLFDLDEIAFRTGGGILGAGGNVFRDDKTTGMDSLKRLSKQTGGKYYSNIALYEKNLEEVVAVTGTYYVLGYSISAVSDGKFHDIRIKVRREGCQVRTQPGYFNPKPFGEYSDLEKNIQLFDLALSERSEFQIPKSIFVSALAYDAGQGLRVRVLTRIPGQVWEQFGGKTSELVVLFFDAQNDLLSLQRTAVSPAEYRGNDLLFTAGASPRPGLTKCRVVIRDLETGQSAVASTKVYVGKPNDRSLYVHTPLLVVEGGGLFHLEGVVKGASETPSWREIYSYDASAYSPVIDGEAIGTAKVGVIVPYSSSCSNPSDLVIKMNLVNSASGENMTVPFQLRESSRRGALEVQSLELSLDKVMSGTYLLYVHVDDKASGTRASTHVSLTLGR